MRCDDAKEFVSAVYDGEAVPPHAAEHIAGCAACRELLEGYAAMGAGLRGYGSLLLAQPVADRTWPEIQRNTTAWWKKGFEMMRVPRIAFASLVLLSAGLGSRLALVEVRAHGEGSVLMLKLTPAEGTGFDCYVSTVDARKDSCGGLSQMNKSNLFYSIKALKRDGDRVLLSVRSRVTPLGPAGFGPDTEQTLPETQSWFTPGETLSMPNTGELKLALTGEWADHFPVVVAANQLLDPGPHEIRLTSPLLLKNNVVAGDVAGSTAVGDGPGEGAWLYVPGEGRFLLSPTPVAGAVPAAVQLNRVSFESNGQRYVLVTGTPVVRGDKLWVVHSPAFRPSPGITGTAETPMIGAGPVAKLL